MEDYHYKRITHLERELSRYENNPAPTVPKYDLSAGLFAVIGGDGINLQPLIADQEYLLEMHYVATDRVDYYVDGTLKGTSTAATLHSFGATFTSTGAIDLGWFGTIDFANTEKVYYWNLKLGSTRGASDILNLPLNVLPTLGAGWTQASYNVSDLHVVTINGHSALELQRVCVPPVNNTTWIVLEHAHATQTNCWYSINFMANSAFKTDVDANLSGVQPIIEIRDDDPSQAVTNMSAGRSDNFTL